MANQMIALQARGPQLPDVGAMNARYANVMANMSAAKQKQDEIARAAEFRRRTEGGVDVLTPEGFNQIAGLNPEGAAALRKSALEKQKADAEFTLGYLGAVNEELQRADTPEQARAIGQTLKQAYPMFAGNIDQTLAGMPTDPAQFPAFRQRLNLSALKASERIQYELEKIKSKEIIGEGGTVGVLTTGGGQAPMLVVPKTYKLKKPAGGQVDLGEQTTVEGGQGGPDEGMMPMPMTPDEGAMLMAPGDRSSRLSADLASPLMNVKNDAEYQVALQVINRVDPDAAAQIKQIMPRFDPARMEGIRAAAAAEFNVVPQAGPQGLVTGARGGVGGPREGYVESSTPFRARVPAPPQGPQPRETAEEVFNKELARGRAQNIATAEAPPKKLTAAQEAKLRANITKDYSTAKDTLEYMLHPKTGIVAAVNGVRNLSRSQKEWLVGKTNLIPSLTEAGQTADTRWENLVGKATRMGLALARLGGSIGPMAVQEWNIVRNMIASTDPVKMSPQALEEQLDLIEATARGVVERVRDAYENHYAEEFARYPGRFQIPDAQTYVAQKQNEIKRGGGRGGSKPGSQYPVMTPEQVKKAPKGTKFRRSDNGEPMVKL